MKERRQYKRFKATLPARLEAVTSGKTKVFDLEIKTIVAIKEVIMKRAPSDENMFS